MSGNSSVTSTARYCAVKSCFNNSFTCRLSFFRFPKDEGRCKEWIELSGRDDFVDQNPEFLNKNYSICSDHFEDDQFLNVEVRNKLISNAVPTLVKKRSAIVTSIFLPESVTVDADGKLNQVILLKGFTQSFYPRPSKRKFPYVDEVAEGEEEEEDEDEDEQPYLISRPCPRKKMSKTSVDVSRETRDYSPKELGSNLCAAVSCCNTKDDCKDLSFFPFPRDFERCMAWARNSGREDLMNKSPDELNKKAVLCATHFDKEHFFPPNKKRIRWDAIPTVFKTPTVRIRTPQPEVTSRQQKTTPTPSRLHSSTPVKTTVVRNTQAKSTVVNRNNSTYIDTNTTSSTPITTISLREIAKPTAENILQSISKYLPDLTISLLKITFLRKRKNAMWTGIGKRLAIIFYTHFPNRYRILKKVFGLPSVKILEKWLWNEQFFPGIQTNHVRILHGSDISDKCKDRSSHLEKKSAVLVMRRLKLKAGLSYDMKFDRIEGLHDLDYVGRTRYVASHAIVFTVKGLVTKWRLPVGYFPVSKWIDVPMIADLLKETLGQLECTGLQVRVLVLAYTAHTQQLMEYLSVTLTHPYIYFMGHRILVVYDPPSLLKCLFYSFKESDIYFGDKNTASWKQVDKFYAVGDTDEKLPIVSKILKASNYCDVTTKMAAQVFDLETAANISVGNNSDDDAISTGNFLKMIAELYSYFSGKLSGDTKQLKQLLGKMKNLYYIKGKEPKPCLRAWHLSISSLVYLSEDLNVEMKEKLNTKILRLKDAQMINFNNNLVGVNAPPTSNSIRKLIQELSVMSLLKTKKSKRLKLEPGCYPKVVQRLSGQIRVMENRMVSKVPKLPDKLEEFPRENGLSIVAGFLVYKIFDQHKCDVCGENWAQMCRLDKGATEVFVLWLENTTRIKYTGFDILAPTERLMDLVFRFEDFISTNFSKVVHMDRPALRFATALRRHFILDLKDMCGKMKKTFLKLFVQWEIVRCLWVYNSKRRMKNKRLKRAVFRL